MAVATTSKQACREIRRSGKLGVQCFDVMEALNAMTLRDFPSVSFSRREVSDYSGVELSSVCGRVNELLAVGYLSEDYARRKCRVTGSSVKTINLTAKGLQYLRAIAAQVKTFKQLQDVKKCA